MTGIIAVSMRLGASGTGLKSLFLYLPPRLHQNSALPKPHTHTHTEKNTEERLRLGFGQVGVSPEYWAVYFS